MASAGADHLTDMHSGLSIVIRRTPLILGVTLVWALGWPVESQAAKTIYRCEKDGHITLTDKPCDGSKESASNTGTTISSASNPSTVGVWSGQLQYSGTEAGGMIVAAHAVVPLTLEFTADGKVSGTSSDNGCNWLGVWSQGGKGLERMITLDVSLTNCRFTGFDRRYGGTFLLAAPDSSGQVNLLAYTPPIPGQKVRGYSLGGTLRRR
jgi:hypothetical protein